MPPLKTGEQFPDDVVFGHIPITNTDPTIVGYPHDYYASEEWVDKKVVLFSVPGAFTPSCQGHHLPPYIHKRDQLKQKGVDHVACIGDNDSWVMCAWAKINGVHNDDILFLSDTKSYFSKNHGWDAMAAGRNGRWAMIIDNGKVTYAENEADSTQVTVSGVDEILKHL